MKKVEAIIRAEDFNRVKSALKQIGSPSQLTPYRGEGFRGIPPYDLLPKMKVEIVVKDGDLERVVNTLIRNARSGSPGDGKIFISSVEEAIRIRTGERGSEALY